MTIDEAKSLKQTTEQKIQELLKEFQDQTKLRVKSVDLYAEDMSGNFLVGLLVSM